MPRVIWEQVTKAMSDIKYLAPIDHQTCIRRYSVMGNLLFNQLWLWEIWPRLKSKSVSPHSLGINTVSTELEPLWSKLFSLCWLFTLQAFKHKKAVCMKLGYSKVCNSLWPWIGHYLQIYPVCFFSSVSLKEWCTELVIFYSFEKICLFLIKLRLEVDLPASTWQ